MNDRSHANDTSAVASHEASAPSHPKIESQQKAKESDNPAKTELEEWNKHGSDGDGEPLLSSKHGVLREAFSIPRPPSDSSDTWSRRPFYSEPFSPYKYPRNEGFFGESLDAKPRGYSYTPSSGPFDNFCTFCPEAHQQTTCSGDFFGDITEPPMMDQLEDEYGNDEALQNPFAPSRGQYRAVDQIVRQATVQALSKMQLGSRRARAREAVPPDFASSHESLVPCLNRVEWAAFRLDQTESNRVSRRHKASDSTKPAFVIDVLIGEPVINVDGSSLSTTRMTKPQSTRHNQQGARRSERSGDSKGTSKATEMSGLSSLPERIRINSEIVSRVLGIIFRGDSHPLMAGPFIMTRPFRALIHYEDEIREWCNELKTYLSGSPQTDMPTSSGSVETHSGGKGNTSRISGTTDAGPAASGDVQDKDHPRFLPFLRSATALEHLRCLLEFIDTELVPHVRYLRASHSQKISFSDVWYIYRPGDEVVADNAGQLYRVVSVCSDSHKAVAHPSSHLSSDKTPVRITCVHIDFDGKQLGPVPETFAINRFDGEKSIKSLPVYPFHGTPELRQKYIDRGKKFLQMTQIRHMHYDGVTLGRREEIDSQVVIDFEEAFAAEDEHTRVGKFRPLVENLVGASFGESKALEACIFECCIGENVYDDGHAERRRNDEFMASLIPQSRSMMPSLALYPRSQEEVDTGEHPITEEELLIMSYRAFGFILRNRKWRKLDITHLTSLDARDDVIVHGGRRSTKRETGFDQLVLPPGHKEMVKSLIAQHFRDKKSAVVDEDYSDIVRGKGKGLIILLHGAPGVGKTTTAECVAEYFRKPLFQITCGDLGIWAKDVENALETHFALASRWGCILLIDEADVFLAARTPTDTLRNGLVSVFLRVLEYYTGILFLTTNRVGDFDEAFASRVHMSLYYPPLDLDSTMEVFALNIKRISRRFDRANRELSVKEGPIGGFATDYWRDYPQARWNGRQIRNACHTALALAEFEAQGGNHEDVENPNAVVNLEVKHFKKVADAYLGFINYLKGIYGIGPEERAKENLLRAGDLDYEIQKENPLLSRRGQSSDARDHRDHPGIRDQGAYPQFGAATAGAGYQPHPSQYPQPSTSHFLLNHAGVSLQGLSNLAQMPQNMSAWAQPPSSFGGSFMGAGPGPRDNLSGESTSQMSQGGVPHRHDDSREASGPARDDSRRANGVQSPSSLGVNWPR